MAKIEIHCSCGKLTFDTPAILGETEPKDASKALLDIMKSVFHAVTNSWLVANLSPKARFLTGIVLAKAAVDIRNSVELIFQEETAEQRQGAKDLGPELN